MNMNPATAKTIISRRRRHAARTRGRGRGNRGGKSRGADEYTGRGPNWSKTQLGHRNFQIV